MDPLAGSPWSTPDTVAGFVRSPPNQVLLNHAMAALSGAGGRLCDIGCGAGRNAVPLAEAGWTVHGADLSWPMLAAAAERARTAGGGARVHLVAAPMDRLPFADRSFDFVVAHGIWNLARSSAEFRAGVAEAARIARPGAPLFVFTFSRHTLPADVEPVPGETFVFTAFSGQPQCFLTEAQLIDELAAAGFVRATDAPLTEYNRSSSRSVVRGTPVIYEGLFHRRG